MQKHKAFPAIIYTVTVGDKVQNVSITCFYFTGFILLMPLWNASYVNRHRIVRKTQTNKQTQTPKKSGN